MSVKRRRTAIEPLDPERYYTAKQLAARYQIHIITLYKWAAKGVIPAQVRLGPNCARWRGRDILEHERQL